MWMTAPIYSVIVPLLGWVYYFLITQRRTLWKEKMYQILKWIQVHQMVHQMSSRSCKIYDWNSISTSTIRIQCPIYLKHLDNKYSTDDIMTTKQVNPVHVHENTSQNAPPAHCAHVHKLTIQVCKPGELLALRKVKHPHNGRTSVNRLPLTKPDILSQYSGCFECIGCFPGDLYKFHLKPEHKPVWHAPRKVQIHLEAAFKEEIKSLVKLGILEEVKEHTDWINSSVIVEKTLEVTIHQITQLRRNWGSVWIVGTWMKS